MSNSFFANNNSNISKSIKIEIYSTEFCPYCTRARMLLDSKGVSYIEFRVDQDLNLRDEMERRSNRTSVPQIFIGNRHIGGFDDLAELEFGEELDGILGLR
ncbi:glutaredoxin 3 [Kaarinaea lacus]